MHARYDSAMPQRAENETARRSVSLTQTSCWLAVILVICKAITLGPAELWKLPMASCADVLFALVCGAMGELLAGLFAKWKRAAALVRGVFVALFALFAAYGVAAIGLFNYFQRPLTIYVLALIRNASVVRSSIFARLTPAIAVALVLIPLVVVGLALTTRRAHRLVFRIAMMIWVVIGVALYQFFWPKTEEAPTWLSPHVELLRSSLAYLTRRPPALPKEFPADYVEDFRTIGARGGTTNLSQAPDAARPKNVILIVLESVGTKYLGLYGSAVDAMPSLNAEAQHALVFDNIYAHASFTYCSFRTINFSVYPGLPWHYALLPNERPAPAPLAATLRARGYRTAYINNGDLDWGDERWLLDGSKAFETINDYQHLDCPPLTSWGTDDRCAFDRLIRWIDEKPGAPFFAICWTDQTHDPYPLGPGVKPIDFAVGDRPLAKDLSAYLNVVHETDGHLAQMFAALRERGLADDTLVVVTGDHGEAFADPHGQRGHAWSVYEEEVRVPLIFWNPRLFPNGARAATIGGHVDLNPTLSDLLGIPPNPDWQGESLFDPTKPNRAYFFAIAGGHIFGLRDGEWKYSYDVASGREFLFNLANDPKEQRNLAAAEAERAKTLRERIAAWVTFEDALLMGRDK